MCTKKERFGIPELRCPSLWACLFDYITVGPRSALQLPPLSLGGVAVMELVSETLSEILARLLKLLTVGKRGNYHRAKPAAVGACMQHGPAQEHIINFDQ